MKKIDRLCKLLHEKAKSKNQLISAAQIRHHFGDVKMSTYGGNYVNNGIGALRRAGALEEVGRVGNSPYYKFTEEARTLIKKHPKILKECMNNPNYFIFRNKAN